MRAPNARDAALQVLMRCWTAGAWADAALGAQLAAPHRQVVAVCGDGAFQMSMCELATICQENANVKIIIMENHFLGMVKEFQDRLYGRRYTATVLNGDPDFVKLAQAYGIEAACAATNEEAKELAKKMLESPRPFILVCRVDPDVPSI